MMMNEIVKTEKEENAFISMIERVAMSPDADVSKLEKMLEMQERIVARQAEQAFNESMARLQPLIPQIQKTKKAHNSQYAPYEAIDKVARPLYTQEGFAPSFNSKREEDGSTTYYGILSHRDGHKVTYEMNLQDDKGGSKNIVQAKASAMSYAKRYLLQMMFNIITTDEDDDGNKAGFATITDEESANLKKLIRDSGADVKGFLAIYGVASVDELPAANYGGAESLLEAKKKQKETKNAGA